MPNADDLQREIDDLRERLSRLSAASLRITEDLDLDTVLREVLAEACTLTNAGRSALNMFDGDDAPLRFITSGIEEDDSELFQSIPRGLEILALLTNADGPLRVTNLSEFLAEHDLPALPEELGPMESLLSAPIRYRGRYVGHLYLANGQDEDGFDAKDEETVVLFAAHAAMAIANAGKLQDERRARLDLQTLIDISPVGVVLFDAQTGEMISINREAGRIAESLRAPDQTLEQMFEGLTIQRGDGREIALRDSMLIDALNVGESLHAEEIVVNAENGQQARVIVNATPIRSDDGQIESFLVTLQDLAPLEDLERMRVEFLAMVSHELRAPLTSIKGSSATLIAAGSSLDPATTHQFHRIIDQQADQMQKLITDLLDVARIEVGALSVSPESVAVADLVDRARSTFISGGGPDQLRIELPPNLPRVMADPQRMVQVLSNLLFNAARNSPDDSIIDLTAVRRDVHVEISVTDRGLGISAERLPHLFRKFSRGAGSAQDGRPPDTGLGLAISKGIVEAHGGRIWVESDGPGQGARFSLTLPAAVEQIQVAAVGPELTAAEPRSTAEGKVRILAVDDDPLTLRTVRETLSQAGHESILTGDPNVVPQLIHEQRPHLVLLDLMLPGTDGVELMKQTPELARLPVIFLSAYGGDLQISRAIEHGADDYIVKPFSPTELVTRIETVLRRSTMSQPTEPAEPYSLSELTINYAQREVSLAGVLLEMTELEYRMLYELSVNAGRVMTHAELLRRVWGQAQSNRSGAVRTIVKQLRQKLGDDANDPTYIHNVPRFGYRMPRPDAPAPAPQRLRGHIPPAAFGDVSPDVGHPRVERQVGQVPVHDQVPAAVEVVDVGGRDVVGDVVYGLTDFRG